MIAKDVKVGSEEKGLYEPGGRGAMKRLLRRTLLQFGNKLNLFLFLLWNLHLPDNN
jgi:hypothetical protein